MFEERGVLHYLFHPSPSQVTGRVVFLFMNLMIWVIGAICLFLACSWVDKPFPGFLVNERMVISGLGLYHWPGPKAGLQFPDKILEANDHLIRTMDDLHQVVGSVAVGTPINFLIEKKGERKAVQIQTIRFTWFDFFLTFGLTFVSGLIFLTLGFVVYILKPDTAMSWAFLLACFSFGIYSITTFDITSTHWGFVRMALVANGFIPAAFLHLSLVFPEERPIVKKYPFIQIFPYAISLLLLLPILYYYPDPKFAVVYALVRVFTLLSVLSLFINTLRSLFQKTSVIGAQRSKVVLLGVGLAFPIPAAAHMVELFGVKIAGTLILNNFLVLPLLLFPVAISYAITKHNLFDVDVYIKRAVGYGLMTLIVGLGYFSLQTVFRAAVLDPLFGEFAVQIYPVLFSVLIVFFFNPLSRAVQDLVDRIFFRKKFDYKDTINSVSNTLTSLLDQRAVIHTLISTVRENMFIDKAGVFLPDAQRGDLAMYFMSENKGSGGKQEWHEIHFSADDPLYKLVAHEKRLISQYEVAESPKYREIRELCEQRFLELGATLAIPLIHQEEVRGLFTVGRKKSGEFYTREDVQLIETLVNQGAVALENARLADQMLKEEMVRTNLARYLSPQIVDQIIDQGVQVNLGGDRKTVTILFSDIRNFTSITESRPPDQLVAILNDYFTEMAKIIFANQGSLDKYIGDAIVAVFGSLIPLENSALHASRAAIQMIKKMPELNERWQQEFGFGMDMGIGLNTGEVFLGNVGSPERMEFTVIGDTVNVASRFSGLAKAGQVLMTRETLERLNGAVQYQELPPSAVKGKVDKLEVFEVVCA